ncbi:MAG: hypothetical protein U1F57_08795 [bacterium]
MPLTKNPITWPRSDLRTYGCFLEKQLNDRPPKYNCDFKGTRKNSLPTAKGYYEGPSFPPSKLGLIDPSIQRIELNWEHGELQGVIMTFKPGISPSQIRDSFHLQEGSTKGLPNVMSIDIQGGERSPYSLILQGFEHQGAGD